MGLDFLLRYGGGRLRQYIEQPPLEPLDAEDEREEGAKALLAFEEAPDSWYPRPIAARTIDPDALPKRFIDGCHSGGTVTPLRCALPHPIPVRLAEIGGVCMGIEGRSLRRRFHHVERIVCFIIDPFPWHEIEDFAVSLEKIGMRLSPVKTDEAHHLTSDYASMAQWTYTHAQEEMRDLEELALDQDPETLTLVDGSLLRTEHPLSIGVIKQHRKNYLGSQGKCWQVFYDLKPGERTQAFKLSSPRPRISWYLKLDGAHGTMPNWGIVRVEISCEQFERQGSDFGYLDRVSNALWHLRCRQNSYARAPVSMEPIVCAERSLKSLFTPPDTLAQHFYHLTGL